MSSLLFEDTWLPLDDDDPIRVLVAPDKATLDLVAEFDYEWAGSSEFVPARVPDNLPTDFGLGVIVGASGSGKSTMLRTLGPQTSPGWNPQLSIAGHFASAAEARERFLAVGLNSVPLWTKPYGVLSTGEKFRANLARIIGHGAMVDEYTSVVDRTVAESASNALARWVHERSIRGMVVATCHRDVLPWLQPDWIIDLDTRSWALRPRECLQRPERVVEVYAGSRSAWDVFGRHHYLSADLHQACRTFVAVMNGHLVGFVATLAFPNGFIKNGWRAHRTVVLPDFQGMGIGTGLSDFVAALHVSEGKRYFSRTAHPRVVAHRNTSTEWRETTHSGERRKRGGYRGKRWDSPTRRVGYSHEFMK